MSHSATHTLEDLLARAHRVLDRNPGRAAHRCLPGLSGAGSLTTRALAKGASVADRLTLKFMGRMFTSGDQLDPRPELRRRVAETRERYGALELIAEPERYFRPPRAPDRFRVSSSKGLKRGVRLRVSFETTYETFDPGYQAEYFERNAPNHINSVHFWRHDDARRPTAICVHPGALDTCPSTKSSLLRARSTSRA